MRLIEASEVFADMTFPIFGLSQLLGFSQQAPKTTVEGENVRAFDALAFRARGGSRPGLLRYLDDQLPHDPENQTLGCDVYDLLMQGFGSDVGCYITLGLNSGTFPSPYALLMQGIGGASNQFHYLLFGLGPESITGLLGPGARLIQHLNVLINPGGEALIDPYIDNHRGWVRIQPEDPIDPIILVPVSSGPLTAPPFDADTGVEDLSNQGNFIRPGGSGAGSTGKLTPVIIWDDPAAITVGTSLSSTELDAVAYAPQDIDPATGQPTEEAQPLHGSYEYTPPLGVALELGNDLPLKVVFTPEEEDVYTKAKKTVHIDVVQANFIQGTHSTSLVTQIDFPDPVQVGDLIVVAVIQFAPTALAVSDTLGTVYTQVGSTVTSGSYRLSLWWGVATSAGGCAVIYNAVNDPNTYAVAASYRNMRGTPFDSSSSNSVLSPTTPGSRTTGSVTVSQENELLVGAFFEDNSPFTFTAGTNFTTRVEMNTVLGSSINLYLEDWINPAAGSWAATATGSSSGTSSRYMAIGASFRGA